MPKMCSEKCQKMFPSCPFWGKLFLKNTKAFLTERKNYLFFPPALPLANFRVPCILLLFFRLSPKHSCLNLCEIKFLTNKKSQWK